MPLLRCSCTYPDMPELHDIGAPHPGDLAECADPTCQHEQRQHYPECHGEYVYESDAGMIVRPCDCVSFRSTAP